MPPKRSSTLDSMSINTNSTSRVRLMATADLITKSQAALSSQASIYTQKTQGSQGTQDANYNFGMGQNDDMQFNREQMNQVTISKEQEQIIQKILDLARKGKVNSKNAFEIPIKVVHSQSSFSVNNKFWKFASQLLSASMSIYDKRVQNMYISTGAFQNKLSRIGFDIKNRKEGQRDEERHDDISADEDVRGRKIRQQRHQMLRISVENFSGALNLEDQSIIGFETIERKEKIDIKNIENKFIADPTFERTQKMFDSFSLKSLMLNIFELSSDLDVRIFYKSDLQWQKLKENENTQNNQNDLLRRAEKNNERISQQVSENQAEQLEDQQNSVITERNSTSKQKFGQASLSYEMQKHLKESKSLINQQIFAQISGFITKQPQLKLDYLERNKKLKYQSNRLEIEEDLSRNDNLEDVPYPKIIQNERNQCIELFKEYEGRFDEDIGGHHFSQIQNGEGLFETNQSQSQTFENVINLNFSDAHSKDLTEFQQANTMPVSFQETFYAWDQKNDIIEPIMPWEIEFKNLKLIKKRKKTSKVANKSSKKNSKKSSIPIVDFQLDIMDRMEVLMQKDVKSKFQKQKNTSPKCIEKNTICKQFDAVHAQYHSKLHQNANHSSINMKKSFNERERVFEDQNDVKKQSNFVFDLNHEQDPFYDKNAKNLQADNADEETRLIESQNYTQDYQASHNFFESGQRTTKNTSFVGHQMGVNNIREIKRMVVDEVKQKGWTSLQYVNKILVNLSPQQLFTIFLHLTNQNQFEISNEDSDETTIILSMSQRSKKGKGMEERNKYKEQTDIQI